MTHIESETSPSLEKARKLLRGVGTLYRGLSSHPLPYPLPSAMTGHAGQSVGGTVWLLSYGSRCRSYQWSARRHSNAVGPADVITVGHGVSHRSS